MNTKDISPDLFSRLERRDLIRFEQYLRRSIARFLPHSGCTLHFPNDDAAREPEYLPGEERLLLPLHAPAANQAGASPLLGVFVARGVAQGDYEALAGQLPKITALAMENLFLYKAALSDPATGLLARQYFIARVGEEVRATSDTLRPEAPAASREVPDPDGGSGGGHPCLAVLVIRLQGLRQIVRKHGYTAGDAVLPLVGKALRDMCPEQGTTARVGDYELAVLMPAATNAACRRFAGSLLEELAKISLPQELSRSRANIGASIGYALYPQDISGNVFFKPEPEQARLLLRKARLAAALAAERLLTGEDEPVLSFGRILAEGGRVVELLPLSRITVSLGSSVNAREGQRFSVWSAAEGKTGTGSGDARAYKGEIVLIEVRENVSVAEIIHQADPSVAIGSGDSMALLPGEVWGAARARSVAGDGPAVPDPATGLLRHGDFLAAWSEGREKCDTFSLALLRILPPSMNHGAEGGLASQPEELMAETVRLFQDVFGRDTVAGRYGLTSLMVFHPGTRPEDIQPKYAELCALLASRFFPGQDGAFTAAGLAGYPYLDFRKADALENCRKALEYGILLPPPHVGVFDSLAMTISADKRFSHGDSLGAMTEYRQALLADDANALAWNSLGVTLARLGRHDEARGHFGRAIALEPDANVLYNMGYTCQSLGEREDAKSFYRQCLQKEENHLYALVRLGQLAESEGDRTAARAFYDKAGAVPGGEAVTRRHLAGLCLAEGKIEEAREHLHEALVLDPQNAVALQVLAEIYLDDGEDAEVAESLARQSVALRPERKAGWIALSRALERAGRPRDAREALMRAGAL